DEIDADQPTLAELEKRYILKILASQNNNREKTAAALGVNKSTLWRKLKEYNE
ncbi:MAG: sigma-54-dependent Fis family transcriptional regulator, partial [Gammaproteobacteria bacterium]|nr:sigma-54-dependent Fis family transcriptional regulator [Gammaproteobacteria bacterium]